jgi:hypothetical protein
MSEGSHEPKSRRGTLDRLQSIATIFSLIAVPVIVAVLGALIQKSVQSSEARTKSMELAINILKEAPGKNSQPGLREWAIETLQASSPIQISDAARKELATKPLFPVQPAQKRYGWGGFLPLRTFGDNDPIEIDDPSDENKKVILHRFVLQRVDEDSIGLLVDGKPAALYINDSLALAPEGCVLHLMGVGHEVTAEDRAQAFAKAKTAHPASMEEYLQKAQAYLNQEDQRAPLNSAYTSFICP